MKRFGILPLLIFSLSFCFLLIDTSEAQSREEKKKKKQEEKEWKKKMKQTDPLAFRDMTDQLNRIKRENSALKKQNMTMQEDKNKLNDEIKAKEEEIEALKASMDSIKQHVDNNVSLSSGEDWTQGIVYKVQIGAFKVRDLGKYMKEGWGIWEEDEDGMKKYTIAYFRDYWEADKFKKYMREMGVKDAWIVAYENNRRKDITDVLDEKDVKKRQQMD